MSYFQGPDVVHVGSLVRLAEDNKRARTPGVRVKGGTGRETKGQTAGRRAQQKRKRLGE